jgi:hypothetical protein
MSFACHVTPRLATLAYERLGTLTVLDGYEIRATLSPDADETLVAQYLTGAALAVLLYQRGLVVVCGSAIAIDGQAIVIISDHDRGTSTLAAVLLQRGHSLLADGIVAIDMCNNVPAVLPAFPFMQLDPDAAHHLGEHPQALQKLHPFNNKIMRMAHPFSDTPHALRAVYYLSTGIDNNLGFVPLQTGLEMLMRSSYPTCLLQPGGMSHVRQCAQVVGAVPVCRLVRRFEFGDLPEQAQMIEDHLASQARGATYL